MNYIKQILVLLFSAIFLLSSTGLFLTFHECETCDITEVFINIDDHGHEHHHDTELFDSCCSGETCDINVKNDTDCCSDDTFYLKISEPYTFSSFKVNFEKISFKILSIISFSSEIKNNYSNVSITIINLPKLFGINLLQTICVFRL